MSLPVTEIAIKGKWFSVPFLDYKGNRIVVKGTLIRKAQLLDEEWLDTELECPEVCAAVLRSQRQGGLHADILTFAQKLPPATPKYNFHSEWDSIAAIRTTSFSEWWDALPRQSRQNVKRSEKCDVKVLVEPLDDNLVRGIAGVHNESAIRQGKRYWHYGKTFEQVKRDHSSFRGDCDYICAYAGQELIGYIWLIYRGETASILQFLTKTNHQDKRPANALIAKAVALCAEKKLLYLTYGMFEYGNKKHDSLKRFKERNGFSGVLVPRYYIPLTHWGKFCMKAHLHRGLIGILPHQVIKACLTIRSMLTRSANWAASAFRYRPRLVFADKPRHLTHRASHLVQTHHDH